MTLITTDGERDRGMELIPRQEVVPVCAADPGTVPSGYVELADDDETGWPLSSGQRRLWFLDQMRPGALDYLLPRVLRLRGPLDAAALDAALRAVVARHEVLRTRYAAISGEPVQIVDEDFHLDLVSHDLRHAPERLPEVLRETGQRPFDLAVDHPLRAVLARTGEAEHVLLIVVHHIAFDGWSWGVLARDLREFYRAARTRTAPALPELPVQYADFADWQAGSAPDERHIAHWRERLAGLAPLELPTDRPRPPVHDARGAAVRFTVPADLVERLARLGRTRSATPFMVLAAGFAALLGRCAGTTDLALGTQVAGRDRAEIEDLVGYFATNLVLRADLSGDPSFAEVLDRVRERTLDGFAHQDVPFERLVDELVPVRDLSRNPLYQAGFVLMNAASDPFALPGLDIGDEDPDWATSLLDLTLRLAPAQDGTLAGTLDYAVALFDHATAERLAAHFVRLLAAAAENPTAPIAELDLLSADERSGLLADSTGPAVDHGSATLPELVSRQARLTPGAVAAVAGPDELTYAELVARANRLAHVLRARGACPETPVAVGLRRGMDLLLAVLAIGKAGASVVPVDPDHPRDRVDFVLRDAGARLVLTTADLADRFSAAPVLTMDRAWNESAGHPPHDPPPPDGTTAAYCLYTSGSTGAPKGVVVEHAGIRNRVLWAVDRHRIGPGDRLLQKTTITFDAAMWEFYAPLVSGATVVMAPDGAHADAAALTKVVADERITVLQLVPSMLRAVVAEPGLARCAALRVVVCGGEPLPTAVCRALRAVLDVEVVNVYGLTETSIDVLSAGVDAEETGEFAPAGLPLPNTGVLILDDDDRLVPVGVPGEVCVAGVHLARGYRGRADATALRFRPHPFPSAPGERLMRTGDRGRRRPDGSIEVLGRLDHQVKLNGVRIEPGEIEVVLAEHPAVKAAAVAVHSYPDGTKRLVAHFERANGRTPSVADLRAHLAAHLPASMIPSVYAPLDKLPTTSSGKVDRGALSPPDTSRAASTGTFAEPSTPTQRAIAAIWSQVLGVERVGVTDNFFTLGGHSLLATTVMFRVRADLGVELPLGKLFRFPTVAGLAALVDADLGHGPPPIPRLPRSQRPPLSFAQRRLLFLDQLDPGGVEYLVPLVWRIPGPLDPAAVGCALSAVVARHEPLRSRYPEADGEPTQVVDPPGPVTVDLLDLSGLPRAAAEARADAAIAAQRARPFQLAQEWPVRAAVVRLARDEHLLLVTLHHIACDAWSTDVLTAELAAAYQAALDGRPPELPDPQLRYRDFAAWQRDWLRGDVLEDHLGHWRTRLAGATPTELPTDRPRTAPRDPAGALLAVPLPAATAAAVADLARDGRTTPFLVLLAAFQVVLAARAGTRDVVVGTPVAGRTRTETQDMVGFFVNTLVARGDVDPRRSFAEHLAAVAERAAADYRHQELPFELLVDELSPERDLARTPLFQVMFEASAARRAEMVLGSAVAEPVTAAWHSAKFDLTVSVELGDEPVCWLEYATALFDEDTVRRLSDHFLRLLAAVAADPHAPLSSVDPLAESERARLLRDWRAPAAAPPTASVPELVSARAAATPQAPAVIAGDLVLTYAQLDAEATRLAHRLRARGIGPERVVASCLERGPNALVVLLGVLKAGGVYVPLDPEHPGARLRTMIADSGAALVLAGSGHAHRLADLGAEVLDVGDPATVTDPADLPDIDLRALAYAIYTSGSTGTPKGVMVQHGSYAQHCQVIAEEYGIEPGDRVALLSALTFDVAMDQIAATLLAGATVVVADPKLWSPGELADRIAEHRVTHVEITPAHYRVLMDAVEPGDTRLRSLKLMNVGSDVVTAEDARRWAAAGAPGRFLCNYGPTEATVTCVLHPVRGEVTGTTMPLGRPVPGTRAHVLDADGELVPVGVPGELHLGGLRLARGYLGRQALTAERFVPDPFGPPGERLYATGDLARHRADGTLEFLGRIDHQVKVRGFRIELGEVEAAIALHPTVAAVAVRVCEPRPGDRRLVAYPVGRDGPPADPAALRGFLADRLPDYMIPSLWVPLPGLPLTPSGKVDRNALPDPDLSRPDTANAYVAPRDDVETALSEIWAEVLGVDRVGAHDDFFHLGGHSLLATRVLARLRPAFEVDLPLSALFDATRLDALAIRVREAVEADLAALTDEEIDALLREEDQ